MLFPAQIRGIHAPPPRLAVLGLPGCDPPQPQLSVRREEEQHLREGKGGAQKVDGGGPGE